MTASWGMSLTTKSEGHAIINVCLFRYKTVIRN